MATKRLTKQKQISVPEHLYNILNECKKDFTHQVFINHLLIKSGYIEPTDQEYRDFLAREKYLKPD